MMPFELHASPELAEKARRFKDLTARELKNYELIELSNTKIIGLLNVFPSLSEEAKQQLISFGIE